MNNTLPLEVQIDFQSIIKGCRQKKRSSQHELYKRYYSFAMHEIYPHVLDQNIAIKIVNDSFLIAYKRISRYNLNHSFHEWFQVILTNTYKTYTKKNRANQRKPHTSSHQPIEEKPSHDLLKTAKQSIFFSKLFSYNFIRSSRKAS